MAPLVSEVLTKKQVMDVGMKAHPSAILPVMTAAPTCNSVCGYKLTWAQLRKKGFIISAGQRDQELVAWCHDATGTSLLGGGILTACPVLNSYSLRCPNIFEVNK